MKVGCGSTYSMAVTVTGELYTWGRGNYGCLGHGTSEDQSTPVLVKELKGHRVVDVACGSGDAQTVAVTDTGLYSVGLEFARIGEGTEGAQGRGCGMW